MLENKLGIASTPELVEAEERISKWYLSGVHFLRQI